MRLKNTFIQGKINKDVDERLINKGEYVDALNIRVSNSDASDRGAIENVEGNEQLTTLGLTNGKVIGSHADTTNQKIYFFVTSDTKDLVIEYDFVTANNTILLESSKPSGILNFNINNLITGVDKIINEDSNKDLLVWTDNLNPPRIINVERAKTYTVDGFSESDISVIKAPPIFAPNVFPVIEPDASDTNLKDKILLYAYRYKYLDGGFSALSSFTYYQFVPSAFDLDFKTGENTGMVNSFNAARIEFDTGGSNVTDVEIVYKESLSNSLYSIEIFNKENEGWGDNTTQNITFTNSKNYTPLPNDELTRTYDNVPVISKTLAVSANRLFFANYTEGFDLIDISGNNINIDYDVTLDSNPISEEELEIIPLVNSFFIKFPTNPNLSEGTSMIFNLVYELEFPDGEIGSFRINTVFVFNRDYTSISDLVSSQDWTNFIDNLFQLYTTSRDLTPPIDSTSSIETGFTSSPSGVGITINNPNITYTTPSGSVEYRWRINTASSQILQNLNGSNMSLKSVRSYEVAMVYLDEYGRKSTALTSNNNFVDVLQSNSENINSLRLQVNNPAPKDAKYYKFAVKQTRGAHDNIYGVVFYEDGEFVWVKLEGSNKDKIKVGDSLIVKSDTSGILTNTIETTVLAIEQKDTNFIDGNFVDETTGAVTEATTTIELVEESGVYMKLRPVGYQMQYNNLTFFEDNYAQSLDENIPTVDVPLKRPDDTFVEIKNNGTVELLIEASVERRSEQLVFKKTYTAIQDYANFRDFFIAEQGLNDINIPNSTRVFIIEDKPTTNTINIQSPLRGDGKRRTSTIKVTIKVRNRDGLAVFETKPDLNNDAIFYETSEVFEIDNGNHLGNVQNQNGANPAIVTLDYYNTFVFGNGIESSTYLDVFNKAQLVTDFRPTAVSETGFKRVIRNADITYSSIYNEDTNVNGLNEFNLSLANFKSDIDNKDGSIQHLFSRETNLLVLQEDKVSYVLVNKDVLFNADGTSNVSSTENVLGQQIPYTGEYGISKNPESFAFDGINMYFTDAKRGTVLRLSNAGLTEISKNGLDTWYKDRFRESLNGYKFGEYDPYHDQYILYLENQQYTISFDESVKGWTSFHSYMPDNMVGMNNEFFSFKNGDLYIHHSRNVDRNNYYGVQYPSTLSMVVNEQPSEIKIVKAISYEGNFPWNAELKAYVSNTDNFISSSIDASEFVQKEGHHYAHTRRNENINHLDSKSTYGIGRILSFTPTTVTITGGSDLICVGDEVLTESLLSYGNILSHTDNNNGTITLSFNAPPVFITGTYLFGKKNTRIEGGYLRGYTMRYDLNINQGSKVELFAVNSEISKSYS